MSPCFTPPCISLTFSPSPLSRSASPHHGFAAYYTYLEKIFKADAVLHFGTHGSLEFMPGKQVRSAGCVWLDAEPRGELKV